MDKKKAAAKEEMERVKFEVGQEMGIINTKKNSKDKKNINKS